MAKPLRCALAIDLSLALFGMDGIGAPPADAPEHFIGESMDRFKLHHQAAAW